MATASHLSGARRGTLAVSTGEAIYLFGGASESVGGGCGGGPPDLRDILRYDSATNTLTLMQAKLPFALAYASGIWDGNTIYLFGGADAKGWTGTTWDTSAPGYDHGFNDGILRYDPSSDTLSTINATLPTGREFTSAVWDGRDAWIIGGATPAGPVSDIVRFDPKNPAQTQVLAALPSARADTSAVWTGTDALIFGGAGPTTDLNAIVQFNPVTLLATNETPTLPTGRTDTSATWNGTSALVFGGYDAHFLPDVVGITPSSDNVSRLNESLPTGRDCTSAAMGGSDAFVFGGFSTAQGSSNDILRIRSNGTPTPAPTSPTTNQPLPGPPLNVTIQAGPGAGDLRLAWAPPNPTASAAPTGYIVLRGLNPKSLTRVGNDAPGNQSFQDTGLANGVTYYYAVVASGTGGIGSPSTTVSARTFALPSPPLNLRIASQNGTQVKIAWDAPLSNGGTPITTYTVYRRTGTTSPYSFFSNSTQLSLLVSGPKPGEAYDFQVRARNAVGDSNSSNDVRLQTRAPPSGSAVPGVSALLTAGVLVSVAILGRRRGRRRARQE
ncbi:MAG: Kelch repeat-containing protein [Thermoplasmatota archaeon]